MTTKTGAVICKRLIEGTGNLEYEAILFITDVPPDMTDEELKTIMSKGDRLTQTLGCMELIVRSDINATGNEIQEQFAGLNNDADIAIRVSYKDIIKVD